MSPQYFVEVRRTLGGPAPEETARAIAEQRRLARRRSRSAAGRGAIAWPAPSSSSLPWSGSYERRPEALPTVSSSSGLSTLGALYALQQYFG